ncbi:MAG: hypothetical protein ACAI43_20035 [Phycisphaerae bacterium]|nr:hypothetical protein [Tepidisphaeraceae bacterium]
MKFALCVMAAAVAMSSAGCCGPCSVPCFLIQKEPAGAATQPSPGSGGGPTR